MRLTLSLGTLSPGHRPPWMTWMADIIWFPGLGFSNGLFLPRKQDPRPWSSPKSFFPGVSRSS